MNKLDKLNMKPFAFLFNADHESLGNFYGQPCTTRVLRALENSNINCCSQILRGDLLPHLFCNKTTSVSVNNNGLIKGRTISCSKSPDMNLYKMIICDFADSLTEKWSTINTIKFPFYLASKNIWTIVLPTISQELAEQIDNQLKSFVPYLGALHIDSGNPIHINQFSLIDSVFFENGTLFFSQNMFDEPEEDFFNAQSYGSIKDPVPLDGNDYVLRVPPSLTMTTLSARGHQSALRIKNKSVLSHREKVAYALLEHLHKHPEIEELHFSTEIINEQEEFVCEENKVRNYLLNIGHPDGKSKAKFFIENLGIERNDWKYLSDQIEGGMKTALLYRIKNSKYGINHGAIMEIIGRNGRTAIIETGWMIKNNESAYLVTAYPHSDVICENFRQPLENISPLNLIDDEKWKDVYKRANLAGITAANNSIPTPMTLVDIAPIHAGGCGFAWVTVPDARRGMAKWLKKNNIGHKNHRSGWDVPANPVSPDGSLWDLQSLEPKVDIPDHVAPLKSGSENKVFPA
ncbi:hypothetical protein QUH73_16070 [Labilibaculum sp. K2S]|uniref:DUF6883 domain-containing protein n=1 Tax=Labilibaculum sp. K2S TaxID=3056386 RepID=UPI0025A41757|nr:DUF6883 domain-containing protein [Labilibaculum sp. K2S]MDM8161339.1 hypothetical protein [Labilibaculum sp. K2S]